MSPQPTKVLHLITGLGTGGAETMLAKLLSRIDSDRFSSSVISMIEPGPLARRITDCGVPVNNLGMKRGIPSPLAVPKLISQIKAFAPAVIQTWMYHANVLGLVAARMTRVPKLVWNVRCSDLDFDTLPRSVRLTFEVHARTARFADAVVVNSASGMRFHQEHGHRNVRWELIQNGFDTDRFRADAGRRSRARAELNAPTEALIVGMVARFDPQKDHATFINAARLLRAQEPRALFVLAGTGLSNANRAIMAQLQEAGLVDQFRLLGEVADTSGLFPAFDVSTLSAAFGEGFPNALGEAMSCEVSCVATDVGDSGLILGNTGRLIPPRNPAALASAWLELLQLDRDRREQLAKAARAHILQRFSLQTVVGSYERLYSTLAQLNATRL